MPKVVKSFDEESNNDSNGFKQNKTMATEGESYNDSEYDGHGDDNNFNENIMVLTIVRTK